ncbi:short-chain dehydrogenase/reductase SDR [Anaeromyxobacter dehalogenans 2CP-1]|uniref:Short-chain dehydrogenase/reductase SDR n=1 Tax=Anaeromyxobacter dehalogenans (strain ATCC BAA-258 / DSM 21875 / 2CP-1) TaxID=455488 RepID=B8JFM0_ANAD2|nr:SDR family oxidoreductase [Anaeromyxobacter dehalogenans]ACL66397.1 short-chain dehydrogenase/reductase SDR [Anaeromyxobacter dehalogenans 2CP-1]
MDLKGKRALVVGGSSGIGLATARLLAARGARVTAAGRDRTKVAALGEGIEGAVLDAASPASLQEYFIGAPSIDLLVLALSGGKGAGSFRSLDIGDLAEGLHAKLLPQLRTAQAALPRLAPEASITFVSAASAGAAIPGTAGLAAINAALEAVVPVLAVELAPIRVNAVSPGLVDTPWWDASPPEVKAGMFEQARKRFPARRVGRPEDLAEVIVTVAANPYMTGTVVTCDGGGRWVSGA